MDIMLKIVPVVRSFNLKHVIWITEEEWSQFEKNGWINARNAFFIEEGKWANKRVNIEKEILVRRLTGDE